MPLDRILLETDAPDALPKVDLKSLVWVPEDPSAPSLGDENKEGDEQSYCSEGNRTATQENKESSVKGALNHPANIQAVSF